MNVKRTTSIALIGLVVLGLAVALIPYRVPIPVGDRGEVRARCRPAIVSAWHRGSKDELTLWAVTVGTEVSGYRVQSGAEPWCAEPGRLRLGASVVGIVVGVVGLAIGRRASRSREPQAPLAG